MRFVHTTTQHTTHTSLKTILRIIIISCPLPFVSQHNNNCQSSQPRQARKSNHPVKFTFKQWVVKLRNHPPLPRSLMNWTTAFTCWRNKPWKKRESLDRPFAAIAKLFRIRCCNPRRIVRSEHTNVRITRPPLRQKAPSHWNVRNKERKRQSGIPHTHTHTCFSWMDGFRRDDATDPPFFLCETKRSTHSRFCHPSMVRSFVYL